MLPIVPSLEKVFPEKRGHNLKKVCLSDKRYRLMKNRVKPYCELSLRVPEATASIRHKSMTKDKVNSYFKAVEEIKNTTDIWLKPSKIWNMDETGCPLDFKPRKCLTK